MKMVALLRGINVGGNKKVPMAKLRTLAEELGFEDAVTYIQSGNLVFEAGKVSARRAEEMLEKAILKHFKFRVEVIIRTAKEWKKYSSGAPFSVAEKKRPNLLLLGLSKKPCAKDAQKKLEEKAIYGEKIKISGDAIWVDFLESVGKSKLTPAVFDRAVGSTVTMRNWKTVLQLEEMLSD